MISPSSFLSLFIFSSLFISIHAKTLIHSTCEICSEQDPFVTFRFCTTSLQAASGSRHADIKELGKISIKLTYDNMTDTRSYIKKLLKNDIEKLSSYLKLRLDDCLDLYKDSISDIKDAMRYYSSKRYYEASLHLSSIMDATTTCDDGFKEKRLGISLLTKRNNATFELAAIGLSIVRILQIDNN
ncbi:hypothetical protein L2E82_14563 [Cichorium intybus]|uniref:Uncharacterized protein n=1 Tax=Cichorium intybus TaxID=13427 RepID=A0ACB9F0C0_CICIN|nr:hypothetical protein L2E82_14563 [Cichorium intybus]